MIDYACIVLEWLGFLFYFGVPTLACGVVMMMGFAWAGRAFLRGVERFGELE